MQIDLVTRHLELHPALRFEILDRLQRAARLFPEPASLRVVVESNGGTRHVFGLEVHVAHREGATHVRAERPDVREALVEAAEALEEQARRTRQKPLEQRRRVPRLGVEE